MPFEKKHIRLKELETRNPEDKRRHSRKKCKIQVDYYCEDGMAGKEMIRDISIGGVFIETIKKFSRGQVLTISIPFVNQDRKIRIKGRVVRVASDGIGIEFDKSSFDIE